MASLVATLFVLMAMIATSVGKPSGLFQEGTLNRAAGCVVGSMACADDCASVLLCTAGGYIMFETCTTDETCDAVSLTCEPISTGQCVLPPEAFKCNSVGAFPDPFDCHRHHYCAELPNGTLVSLDYQCEEATAYDPLTTLCLLTEDDRVCREGPIPACELAGQTGPQLENPNIYYICVRDSSSNVVPWLFRCPRDTEVFDGVDCVPRNTTTSTSQVTSPPTSSTTDTPWTSTTTPWTTTTPTTTSPTTTPTTTTWTTTTPTTTLPWTTTTPTTTWITTTTPTTTHWTTTTPTTTRTTTTPTTTTPTTTTWIKTTTPTTTYWTTTIPTTTLPTTTPTTTTPTTATINGQVGKLPKKK